MKRIEWVKYDKNTIERRLDIRLPFGIWIMVSIFDSYNLCYGAYINFGDGFVAEVYCYPISLSVHKAKDDIL